MFGFNVIHPMQSLIEEILQTPWEDGSGLKTSCQARLQDFWHFRRARKLDGLVRMNGHLPPSVRHSQ